MEETTEEPPRLIRLGLDSGAVCGVGPWVLHLLAEVPREYIEGLGLEVDQSYLAQEEHSRVFWELPELFKTSYECGGVAVAVRVAQWMLQSPGATSLVGCVGKDRLGKHFVRRLQEAGVRACGTEVAEGAPSDACAVLKLDAKLTLVAELGASKCLDASTLATVAAADALGRAQIVYVPGYVLAHPASAAALLGLARQVADTARILIFNLSAVFLVDHKRKELEAMLPFVDVLVANEDEAAAWGRQRGLPRDPLETIAKRLAASPKACGARARVVAITRGPGPTLVAAAGQCREYPVEALAGEMIVDHMGQGDAFVGGFASLFILDRPLGECVRAAHWCARRILQRPGVTLPTKCDYIH